MKKIVNTFALMGALILVSCTNDLEFDAYNTLPQNKFW